MNTKDKAKIKEIYFQHPELSARQIARQMLMPTSDVIIYLRTIGYTANRHERARQLHKAGKKPASPVTFAAKKAERKEAETIPNVRISKIQPEVEERKKQTALYKKANELLRKAEQAAESGNYEEYLELQKEYAVAQRQAESYKQRGAMTKAEREMYNLENKYTIYR